MARIRFMHDNLIDYSGVVITSSTEDSGFPLSNLLVDNFSTHFRTTADASQWIKFNLLSAKAVTAFAIRYHNLTAAATVVLEGHSSDAWGAPEVSEAVTVTDDIIILYLSGTKQWWRVTIDDAANPDGIIKIGRPFLGPYFEPGRNYITPRTSPIIDPSIKMYSSGGGLHVERENTYRAPTYEWGLIKAVDFASFEAMFETVGANKAFFVCENADHATPYLVTYYLHNLADSWGMGQAYGTTYQGPVIPCAEMRE